MSRSWICPRCRFKNNLDDFNCPNCYHDRPESVKLTKGIAKVSGKQSVRLKEYVKEKDTWLIGKRCGVAGCFAKAQDIHHQAGREGDLLLDKNYWLGVCRTHHRKITEDTLWAIQNGYSVSRLKTQTS